MPLTKSIEERIRDARHALALIVAGLNVDTDDTSSVTEEEMADALADAAERAHNELYWLTRLPAEVLNLPAPTDDEREAAEGAR